MNLLINVKGSSKKITTIQYVYSFQDGKKVSVGDFLDETVKITLDDYLKAPKEVGRAEISSPSELHDQRDILAGLLHVMDEKTIKEKAENGKVAFGRHYNVKNISLAKAQENARQCFLDGMVALFIDETRYEKLEDTVVIKEGSEVTFVKLTFLAGRMW